MKTIFSILFLLSICCSKNYKDNENLYGFYKSPENNYINKLKYGVFAVDLQLELKKDSSYTYSTCSQISKGKWKFHQNQLTLVCESRKFVVDSLNNIEKYNKGKICPENEIFQVKSNSLIREYKTKNKSFKIVLLN